MNNKESKTIKKECVICRVDFTSQNYWGKKYCDSCRNKVLKSGGSLGEYPNVNTGTVGAISELKVAIDLMSKGYKVFRALSPMCSCDLAVLKDKTLLRVEVTTGHFNGHYSSNKTLSYDRHDPKNFDIIAVVTSQGILYKPEVENLIEKTL